MKNRSDCEKRIKKHLIKVHRDIFGKGPREIWVNIFSNVGTFYCSQTLTTLENYFLTISEGEQEVLHLRRRIAKNVNPVLCVELEKICSNPVLSLTSKLCLSTDMLYGAILFEEPFDD